MHTASEIITGTRTIRHDLIWFTLPEAFLTNNFTYEHNILLNDSDDSQLGPGTWLDDSGLIFPNATFRSTLPEPHFRISRIGDQFFHARFGLGTANTISITANTAYFIEWTGTPGDANQDNGDLEISLNRKLFPGCNISLCTIEHTRCTVNPEPFGLVPIPGTADFAKPPPEQCFSWRRLFLPLIIQ